MSVSLVLSSVFLPTSWQGHFGIVECVLSRCNMPYVESKRTKNRQRCDSLDLLNGSGYTVETLWHCFPFLGHFHHSPSVQHTIAKQVVKLQAHAVSPPLVDLVMELVPLGGQD